MYRVTFNSVFFGLLLVLTGAAWGQARGGAAPAPAPSTRPWILGSSSTKPILIPATQPQEKRPELSLQYDSNLGVLVVTLTNNSEQPIVVDHELIVPLYFTFFNERDLPIRAENVEGADPERGNVEQRFAKLDPGQSVKRMIDLNGSFPVWMSGTVSTVFNEEQREISFGREKFRKLMAGAKVKRVQAVYAVMPADRDAIPSYCEQPMEDLCAIPMQATLTLPDGVTTPATPRQP
jgi:hypothetical protein